MASGKQPGEKACRDRLNVSYRRVDTCKENVTREPLVVGEAGSKLLSAKWQLSVRHLSAHLICR